MKIKVEKAGFGKAVQFVAGVAAKNRIAADVLLKAGDRIELFATNLEQTNSVVCGGSVSDPGVVLLPAAKLRAIVANATDDIEIESDGQHVKIKSGRVRHKLVFADSESFPALPNFWDDWLQIPGRTLLSMLEQVDFCIAKDDARYVFNGVYLERDKDSLRVVATDGRRLSVVSRALDAQISGGIILPSGFVHEVKKFLGDRAVFFSVQKNVVGVRDPESGFSTYSQLIEGKYPDYRQVIPLKSSGRVEVARAELQSVLDNMIIADSIRKVTLTLGKSPMVISSSLADVGESKGEVDCVHKGESHDINLNAMYLLEALGAMTAERVAIEFSSPVSPVKILDPTDEGWLSVLMPMK